MTTIVLFFFGAGLLGVAYKANKDGVIPAGAAGLRAYRPTRSDSPLAFHFFLTLYICSGIALLIWGMLVIAGVAEPLKLA